MGISSFFLSLVFLNFYWFLLGLFPKNADRLSMKSDKKYNVRRLRERLGEITLDEMILCLQDGLPICDFDVLVSPDENSEPQWRPLSQAPEWHQAIAIMLSSSKARPGEEQSVFYNWKIEGASGKLFSMVQLIQLLQQNKIQGAHRLSHPRFQQSHRAEDLLLFSDENIKALHGFPLLKPLFQARKNLRMDYSNRAQIHTASAVIKGQAWSLSEEGVGIELETPLSFRSGDVFQVYLMETSEHGEVQVPAKVVSCSKGYLSTRVGLHFEKEVPVISEYMASLTPTSEAA